MEQQQLQTENVQQDVFPDKANIKRMVQTAWFVLVSNVWPQAIYLGDCKAAAVQLIRSFIESADIPYKAFAELCQRILMMQHYLSLKPGYRITTSLLHWLDPQNKHGFAGTAAWFATLADKRRLQPLHLLELKAFPEAMLELAEDPSADVFHYWNNWFLERNNPDLHRSFQTAAVQLVFANSSTRLSGSD